MTLNRAVLAAQNNAEWVNIMCSSHGSPGKFTGSIWYTDRPAAPYNPRAVTLNPEDAQNQRAVVERLLEASPSTSWAVKDSFNNLNLHDLGFQTLFEARWIWRDAFKPPSKSPSSLHWSQVKSAEALNDWIIAWNGGEPFGKPMFLPQLLHHPKVTIYSAHKNSHIVAGFIVNCSGSVAGLSNIFANAEAGSNGWDDAVSLISKQYPDLPIVGYERGDDLVNAKNAGFEHCGALRVLALPDSS